MLLCYMFMLCLHTLTVTSQCQGGFGDYKATLDINRRPIWFQTIFTACANGAKVARLKAKTIHFETPVWPLAINEFFNFTHLEELTMDNCQMWKVPYFYDLPKIKRISLGKNEIENIAEDAFVNVPVQIIVLSRNQITTIGDGAFGNELNALYLTCNFLSEFSPTWFRNASALTKLTLSANQLTSLPENVFKDFVNLKSIALRNNEIITIDSGAFGSVADYDYLDLSWNNISEIPADAFTANQVNIYGLNIQYNRLSFLSDALLDKLVVGSIRIWANPWQCPCETKIERWIEKQEVFTQTQLKREEDPNCVYAQTFSNKCVPYADDDLYNEFLKNFIINPLEICIA